MIEQFINFVIRPPRAEYNPDQYLWERDFTFAGRAYRREDLELTNGRGHILRCSHYMPSPYLDDTPLPCVIYCHGNSGCRADANEAAFILLPSNITVFTLDFSGSGLSDGDYVSLGWHERDDLKCIVSYLRSSKWVSCIGLWGRSMGAVTSLLYGSEDPSIAGMVLDSAFSNLFDLMLELVDVYKIRLPKFTVKMVLQYMRRVIQKKAKFDIMDLNCTQVLPKTSIPALFAHAIEDKFIQPHHSDILFKLYPGDKNIIKFDGDHNTSRPQFFYDSVLVFFYKCLHPPQVAPCCENNVEKYYNLEDMKIRAGIDKTLGHEIITDFHIPSIEDASSSSAPQSLLVAKSKREILSELTPVSSLADLIPNGDSALPGDGLSQVNVNGENECFSFTSSTRESWGRCSSLEGSDSADDVVAYGDWQVSPESPERSTLQNSCESLEVKNKTKKKMISSVPQEPKRVRLGRLGALSQRLRFCMLKRGNHRNHYSA